MLKYRYFSIPFLFCEILIFSEIVFTLISRPYPLDKSIYYFLISLCTCASISYSILVLTKIPKKATFYIVVILEVLCAFSTMFLPRIKHIYGNVIFEIWFYIIPFIIIQIMLILIWKSKFKKELYEIKIKPNFKLIVKIILVIIFYSILILASLLKGYTKYLFNNYAILSIVIVITMVSAMLLINKNTISKSIQLIMLIYFIFFRGSMHISSILYVFLTSILLIEFILEIRFRSKT